MATIARLKTLISVTSIIYVFSILCSAQSLRQLLSKIFSPSAHPIRFGALVLALALNSKSLPLVWHLRFFRILVHQLYFQKAKLPRDALFRPIINSSVYTPIPETDYNGHKSNSTYFADLDMARTELVTCLLRKGIRNAGAREHPEPPLDKDGGYQASMPSKSGTGNGNLIQGPHLEQQRKPKKTLFAIALGAVSCHFKKEIKPYQSYEIWTRILSWDRKWIYLMSHVVKAGAVPPEDLALQPWKKNRIRAKPSDKTTAEQREEWKNAIYATSLAKYVVKRGRQTVPPELVLRSSDLLPPGPEEGENDNVQKPWFGKTAKDDWTWEGVEHERLRGLRLAEHFGALDGPDGLHDEFPVSGGKEHNSRVEVLGTFKDLYL